MKCSNCGAENADYATVCTQCGNPLTPEQQVGDTSAQTQGEQSNTEPSGSDYNASNSYSSQPSADFGQAYGNTGADNTQAYGNTGADNTQTYGNTGADNNQTYANPGAAYNNGQPYVNQAQPYYQPENTYVPGSAATISMWAWVGYIILFNIPCVGLIVMLIYAFGGQENESLKNYARANLIIQVIAVVVMILLYVFVFAAVFAAAAVGSSYY